MEDYSQKTFSTDNFKSLMEPEYRRTKMKVQKLYKPIKLIFLERTVVIGIDVLVQLVGKLFLHGG